MRFDFDMRVDVLKTIFRGRYFGAADVFRAMNDLTLKIRSIDHIEIDHAQPADSRGREIHAQWRS